VTEPIILGHAGEQPLELDLDRLVGSHLGIVANAGGGKSGLIRRLLEQTHGRIQHIILDIEDEFYSLRERFDYVIAGGDGDAPATVDNAAALARGALEHGFSLICQLNDLGGEGAREFVHAFLSAMLMAPRDLWRPCLIVIDETQRFDADSIRMLTERGRKRGFTAVLASQRLPKIDANIRGDLNNWIMGRVGQSLDRRIMADQLGMTKAGERELAGIQPRHFWAMGPALSADPVLFEVADVSTTMVRPGQAKVPTPPAPEALREILAGLAAAPADDEAGAALLTTPPHYGQAAEIAELKRRIAELEAERDEWTIERGVGQQQLDELQREVDRLHGVIAAYQRGFEAQAGILADISWPSVPRKDGTMPHEPRVIPPVVAPPEPAQPPARPAPAASTKLGAERKPLAALAAVYPSGLTEAQWATSAGFKRTGGTWGTYKSRLRSAGLIEQRGDRWFATEAGAGAVGDVELPPKPGPGLVRWWADKLPGVGPMAEVLIQRWPQWTSREDLAEYLGMAASGGTFGTYLSRLAGPELIERDRDRGVRLNPEMMG
jgi:hypothetical protein